MELRSTYLRKKIMQHTPLAWKEIPESLIAKRREVIYIGRLLKQFEEERENGKQI